MAKVPPNSSSFAAPTIIDSSVSADRTMGTVPRRGGGGTLRDHRELLTAFGFTFLLPYDHEFTVNAKGRWVGRTIEDIFVAEFPYNSREYYRNAAHDGRFYLVRPATKKKTSGPKGSLKDQKQNAGGELNSSLPSSPLYGRMPPGTTVELGDIITHKIHRHELPIVVGRGGSRTQIPVLYDAEGLIVVDKPPSLPVHPCGRYHSLSLTEILGRQLAVPAPVAPSSCSEVGKTNVEISTPSFRGGGEVPLYPIHRLDKATSGVLMLARTKTVAANFSSLLVKESAKLGEDQPVVEEGDDDVKRGEGGNPRRRKRERVATPPALQTIKNSGGEVATAAPTTTVSSLPLESNDDVDVVPPPPHVAHSPHSHHHTPKKIYLARVKGQFPSTAEEVQQHISDSQCYRGEGPLFPDLSFPPIQQTTSFRSVGATATATTTDDKQSDEDDEPPTSCSSSSSSVSAPEGRPLPVDRPIYCADPPNGTFACLTLVEERQIDCGGAQQQQPLAAQQEQEQKEKPIHHRQQQETTATQGGSPRPGETATAAAPWKWTGVYDTIEQKHQSMKKHSARKGVASEKEEARHALTVFRRLFYDAGCDESVVVAELYTGRTHQIRVHLSFLGFPIRDDPKYGGPSSPCPSPRSNNSHAVDEGAQQVEQLLLQYICRRLVEVGCGSSGTVDAPPPSVINQEQEEKENVSGALKEMERDAERFRSGLAAHYVLSCPDCVSSRRAAESLTGLLSSSGFGEILSKTVTQPRTSSAKLLPVLLFEALRRASEWLIAVEDFHNAYTGSFSISLHAYQYTVPTALLVSTEAAAGPTARGTPPAASSSLSTGVVLSRPDWTTFRTACPTWACQE